MARLDARTGERTPWVSAVGIREEGDVPATLLRTLLECEPHELEGLRADFETARATLGTLAEAAEGATAEADEALDQGSLRKRMTFLERFTRGGRPAAFLRVLRREGRVLDGKGRPRIRALLAEHLSRRLDGAKE